MTNIPIVVEPYFNTGIIVARKEIFMAYNETCGTHTNTACPHCGKNNHYVSDGVNVVCGKITSFKKPCFHCEQTIYYRASHEIATIAGTEDLITRLRS